MSMHVERRAHVGAGLRDRAELAFKESGLTISEALRSTVAAFEAGPLDS
jgi:antitoxin component of RelBE/YafQ-DinJ toxin-antitoxin module